MGYKRYGNSGSVPTFNDDNNGEAVSNGILKNSSKKEIYFGIAKPKGSDNFRSLQNSDFSKGIQSNIVGCTATLTSIANKLNIGQIRYNLSENTTGAIRNITFKYNNIDLFTIVQQKKIIGSETYTFRIAGFQGSDTVIIKWNGTNFSSDDTTIACDMNDLTPNSDGSHNVMFTINITSGNGSSYVKIPLPNKVYVGHTYSLVGPCVPSTLGNIKFKVDESQKKYLQNGETIIM